MKNESKALKVRELSPVTAACFIHNKNKQHAASQYEIINDETDLNPRTPTMQ